MATLVMVTGFEHGVSNLTSLTKGNTGNKLFDVAHASPTMTTSTPRNGTYCLELNPAAAWEDAGWGTDTFGTSKNVMVMGFAIYFPTSLPAGNCVIYSAENTSGTLDCSLVFRSSDSKLAMQVHDGSGTPGVGPVVAANTWYWIDLKINVSGTTWTMDWAVNGAAQTQGTRTGQTAQTHVFSYFSAATTQTITCRYDNVVMSVTSADYPLGKHKVVLLKADTGGTTAEIGTPNATGRMITNSAIDATHNSANILAALSEGPPPTLGGSASGVGQRTSGATNAVGIPMTSYTLQSGESISGMRVEIVGWAATTAASSLGLRTYNGTTETVLFAAAATGFDNNTTSPAWICRDGHPRELRHTG